MYNNNTYVVEIVYFNFISAYNAMYCSESRESY